MLKEIGGRVTTEPSIPANFTGALISSTVIFSLVVEPVLLPEDEPVLLPEDEPALLPEDEPVLLPEDEPVYGEVEEPPPLSVYDEPL